MQQLAAEWTDASAQLSEIKIKIRNNLNSMQSLMPNIKMDNDAFRKRKPDEQKYLKEMKTAFETQYNGLSRMQGEFLDFEKKWSEHYSLLQDTQSQLKSDKTPEDIEDRIVRIENILLESPSSIDSWNKKADGSLTTAMTAYQHIFQLMYQNK